MKTLLLFLCSFFLFLNLNAAEFFLRTEKAGYYSVSISDQTLIASSNTFRFFDLGAGVFSVTVTDIYTGNAVFAGNVQLQHNKRTVMRLDQQWRLHLVDEITVSWTNWYMQDHQHTPQSNTPVAATPAIDFAAAKAEIDREAFDNSKLEKAKAITKGVSLTAQQIAELCSLFTFDNSKLEYAKFAYDSCLDKSNYFKVGSTMTFSTNRQELDKFIKNKK